MVRREKLQCFCVAFYWKQFFLSAACRDAFVIFLAQVQTPNCQTLPSPRTPMNESRGPEASVPMKEVPGGAAGAEAPTPDEAAVAWDPSLPTPSAQVAINR